MICERTVNKTRCKQKATVFRCGQWLCHDHKPKGATSCSHSLRGVDDACVHCGAER